MKAKIIIYQTGELEQKSTVAKTAIVQKAGSRKIKREIERNFWARKNKRKRVGNCW